MNLVAIGDLHGNVEALLTITKSFNLINSEKHWIGKESSLVILGDVCDRGEHSKAIYDLLILWQSEAEHFGSEVLFILGNHEVMTTYGYDHYSTAKEMEHYRNENTGRIDRLKAFSPGGYLFQWFKKQDFLLKRGDLVFGHGDLPQVYHDWTIDEINERYKNLYQNSEKFIQRDEYPEPLFDDKDGLLWCRAGNMYSEHGYEDFISTWLADNEAKHYICGHTPNIKGDFKVLHNKHYVCVDTAITAVKNGMGRITALVYNDQGLFQYSYKPEEKKNLLS